MQASHGNLEQSQTVGQLKANAKLFGASLDRFNQISNARYQQTYGAKAEDVLGIGTGGTAPAASSGGFVEGKTYTDAKGNKAIYQNGKFVEQ